jgi:hypothetical protein
MNKKKAVKFNEEIVFSVKNTQKLKIVINSTAGKKLKEIFIDVPSGEFSYKWDGKIEENGLKQKGIFVYKIYSEKDEIPLKTGTFVVR